MLYHVKAGIIGLDNVGKSYAELLKYHIKNLKLIGASGKTQRELLYAKNDLSLQYVYSDHDQLIENNDVDAVFIFGGPDHKANIATRAIEAGKHVFISLPIATNVEDADHLVKTAGSHPSQKTMAGFAWRLDPRMKLFKQYIDGGKIGTIQSLHTDSNLTQNLSSRHLIPSGSPFIDHALNEIDLSFWLMNTEAATVRSYEKLKELHSRTIMKDGVIFDLTVFRDLRRRKGCLQVTGSEGVLSIDNYHSQLIKWHRYETETEELIYIDEELPFNTDYLHIRNFTDSILGNTRSQLELKSNVAALKMAIAMEKSKVLGEVISFTS